MKKKEPRVKPYRESRVTFKVLKKPLAGGEYNGKRAKEVEP